MYVWIVWQVCGRKRVIYRDETNELNVDRNRYFDFKYPKITSGCSMFSFGKLSFCFAELTDKEV